MVQGESLSAEKADQLAGQLRSLEAEVRHLQQALQVTQPTILFQPHSALLVHVLQTSSDMNGPKKHHKSIQEACLAQRQSLNLFQRALHV